MDICCYQRPCRPCWGRVALFWLLTGGTTAAVNARFVRGWTLDVCVALNASGLPGWRHTARDFIECGLERWYGIDSDPSGFSVRDSIEERMNATDNYSGRKEGERVG